MGKAFTKDQAGRASVTHMATDGAGRTLRYEIDGTLLVLVHGARSPSDVDWDD